MFFFNFLKFKNTKMAEGVLGLDKIAKKELNLTLRGLREARFEMNNNFVYETALNDQTTF